MDPLGDINLNGKPYRIDLASYREKDLADFSPRASVAGGSIAQSELMLYQPLYLTDWRHGLGFLWHTDAMGYMTSMGNIDTRQPGIVMLFTDKDANHTQDVLTGNKIGMTKFNGTIYAWGPNGLQSMETDGSGNKYWVTRWNTDGIGVNWALATANYLFFCPDTTTNPHRLYKMDTTGAITLTGEDNAYDIKWLVIHKGYVYAGISGSNWIHYSTDPELADLSGDTTPAASGGGTVTDPAAITCGFGGFGTLGAISYANELYVFRQDGVWVIGSDNVARKVLDYSGESSESNFTGKAVFNSYLYYSVRNKIYQWNGSRVVEVTPPRFSDQFPYSEVRTIGPMVVANNFMYTIINWYNNPTESSIPGIGTVGQTYTSLFCNDGVGWHKLADLEDDGGGQPQYSSLFVDGDNNKIYFFLSNSNPANSYFGSFNLGPTTLPSAPFPTTGTHILISSRLDMGFRRVDKFSPSLLVEASNIDWNRDGIAPSRYLKVSALLSGKIDQEVEQKTPRIISLGYVTQNGVTELRFPGVADHRLPYERLYQGTAGVAPLDPRGYREDLEWEQYQAVKYTQSVYKYVILIVEVITNDSTQTPILEGLTLRFLLRPDVFYGYNFNIVAATHMVEGENVDTRTAGDIVTELKSMRDSKHPVTFVDIYGLSHQVYISSVTNTGVERHSTDLGPMDNIESLINLNIVETK